MIHPSRSFALLSLLTAAALGSCQEEVDPEAPDAAGPMGTATVGAVATPPDVTLLSNPYETIRDWGNLPDGRELGQVSAVHIDPDGRTVWVADRCGSSNCVGSSVPVVLHLDPDGNLLSSFASGEMFIRPHGIHIDADGNVWVADHLGPSATQLENNPAWADRGHQVFKFSREGEILMTLGTPGVAGDPPEHLTQPSTVITAPNGDIFVAEGHSNQGPMARVSKFSSDGTFLKSWGGLGSDPGQFSTPHAFAFDSQGRLFVADRGNNRVQIFDQEGNFLEAWTQFGRPNDVWIDADDRLYVLDSESDEQRNPGFRRGTYIGSARDGELLHYIPPHETAGPDGTAGEGITVDADGNIYVGEVSIRGMTKYILR